MATAFLICLLLFARRMKLIGWTFEQSTVMAVAIMLCSLIGAFFLHRLIAAVDNTSASEGSGFVLYGGIIAGTASCIFLFENGEWTVYYREKGIILNREVFDSRDRAVSALETRLRRPINYYNSIQ